VPERGGELDLAAEAVRAHVGRQLGREQLDDDLAAEAGLLRHEHAAHGAAAQLALEGVAAGERSPKTFERVGLAEAPEGDALG
jgi:hypothetical protein